MSDMSFTQGISRVLSLAWYHGFVRRPLWRRCFMRSVFGSRDHTVRLLGSELCVNALQENGYFLASQLSGFSAFVRDESPVLLNLAFLLAYSDAFLDIGANIGTYSSILSRLRSIRPDLDVHAFEVDPDTAKRLKANSDRYSFRVHQAGVSDHTGKATFMHGSVSHLTSVATSTDLGNSIQTFETSIVDLDSFDWDYSRLVLKIDVEGSEYEVLTGAKRLFAEDRILAVYLDSGYGKPDEIHAFLTAKGFKMLEGRTLQPASSNGGVLALNERKLMAITKALSGLNP